MIDVVCVLQRPALNCSMKRQPYSPNFRTFATTSTLAEAGEVAYREDFAEHLYVTLDGLVNVFSFADLIVSTDIWFPLPSTVPWAIL